MTVLGRGDLSPPRRHRYGRRRRRWPRLLLVLVLLGALGAAGYYGWKHFRNDGTSTSSRGQLPKCAASPLPTSVAVPPTLSLPPVRVLNGNLRPGLAATVAHTLHRRFHLTIAGIGNAASFLRGASVVQFPARYRAWAGRVALMVMPGAHLALTPTLNRVQLELGTAFRAVASRTEYRQAALRQALHASPPATATPSASPTPCATP